MSIKRVSKVKHAQIDYVTDNNKNFDHRSSAMQKIMIIHQKNGRKLNVPLCVSESVRRTYSNYRETELLIRLIMKIGLYLLY